MRLLTLVAALLIHLPAGLLAQGWIEPLPHFRGPHGVVSQLRIAATASS